MTEHAHDHRSDDLAAYALGALEAGEATELERHLEGCERCRAELRWLEPAVRRLPEQVERLEPPPRLRDRLMAEVRADADADAAAPAPVAPRRLWSGFHGWKPLAGLAAVLLALVAIVGYQVGSNGDAGGGEQTISSGRPPGVTAEMVREGERGTLRLANVHQLPRDKVLEAWVQREGEIEAVPALFVPDREGRASTTIADLDGVEVVMVTAELQGGSETPTGEPLVSMEVPQ